jgi:iron-sulfur cluster repair protein YtfE (RIC family)
MRAHSGKPPTSRGKPKSLAELASVHAALHERLLRHRDRVVGLEWREALETLEDFAHGLRAHMEDEERLLLPAYARLGGDPGLYLAEHANLRRQLDRMLQRARALAADPSAGRRRAHEFLDDEWMLLHLLEHHQRREHAALFPELDRGLAVRERDAILGRLETTCGR